MNNLPIYYCREYYTSYRPIQYKMQKDLVANKSLSTIFKCTSGGNEGKGCGVINPDLFVSGLTNKCRDCHAAYERCRRRSKTLGVPVSQIRVEGKGRNANVTILRDIDVERGSNTDSESESEKESESESDEKSESESEENYGFVPKKIYNELLDENLKMRERIFELTNNVHGLSENLDAVDGCTIGLRDTFTRLEDVIANLNGRVAQICIDTSNILKE